MYCLCMGKVTESLKGHCFSFLLLYTITARHQFFCIAVTKLGIEAFVAAQFDFFLCMISQHFHKLIVFHHLFQPITGFGLFWRNFCKKRNHRFVSVFVLPTFFPTAGFHRIHSLAINKINIRIPVMHSILLQCFAVKFQYRRKRLRTLAR